MQTLNHFIPYLSFNGNCAEAMRFYERVLEGKLEALLSYEGSPMAAEMPPMSPEMGKRIMHAYLTVQDDSGHSALMAGDHAQESPYEAMKGFTLTLNYATVARATEVFNALAEGGTVTMPMSPAFWAKSFGMCTDRFGTPWIVNGETIPLAT